ncbi:aldo/keto reductase [Mesorhizobium sp. BAC0120]|uniref:aldo/keto reductase n=1 Tax=Mesorhizobium sp. BAC0120 TaxID=3090670 RepID=UPI00298D0BB9|nr:aldo/keto reductase [Mesorhizobium sp. BAC0120]MDW6024265.1 aldo/keto reductase [Mesorhizobium sp. BAC0120]
MATVELGSQGLAVSAQGLGCMGMSTTYGPSDESENLATLARALELGVTFFDTAEVYGPFLNEELLGKAFAGKRDRIVLATKVGFRFTEAGRLAVVDGQPVVTGDVAYLRQEVEGSLRRLRTDVIDLLYLHRIATDVPVEETIGGLARLVDEGKVRFLGVSEASPASIRRGHATHPLTAVQAEYSLFERGVEQNGVLATVRELGIGFVSYAPLGRGFLTGALKTLDGLDRTDFRHSDPRFQDSALVANMALIERIIALADAKGVKPSQLAIAWTMRMGTVPIPGTRRIRYLEENATAVDVVLTDDDLRMLDAVAPAGAAAGDRYSPGMMKTLNK